MDFRGGYSFKNFEGTAEPVLREFSVPKTAVVSTEFTALAFTPTVKTGDTVKAGQTVFRSDEKTAVELVSPVNGTVREINGGKVTVVSDSTPSFEPVGSHARAPWHLDRSDVFRLFRSSGCVLLLDGHFSSLADMDGVKNIIINAVHNAPLDQSWTPGMIYHPHVFSNGLKTLSVLFPGAMITIGINKKNKKYFNTPEITDYASVQIMSDRYPQEHPELLVRDTIHRRFVSPEGFRDPSILVIPFFDLIQTAEIMTLGRPFIDRILMIAGPGVSNPGWYRVRIGTPFEALQDSLFKSDAYGPWRIIRGNLFNGESIVSTALPVYHSDAEISVIRENAFRELWRFMRPGFTWDSYPKTTVAGLLPILPKQLDSNVHGGVRPCVQCNYCDEVCPVAIYPHLIWKYAQAGKADESFRFKPYDCIGCRLCDYVCPSKIDISEDVMKAKESYHSLRRSDEKSD